MFCNNCGKKLDDTASFCIYCGSKVEKDKKKGKKKLLITAACVVVALLAGVVTWGSIGRKAERISSAVADDIVLNEETVSKEEKIPSKKGSQESTFSKNVKEEVNSSDRVKEEETSSKTVLKETVSSKSEQKKETSSKVIQDDYSLTSEEVNIIELRNTEMESQSIDYKNLAIEPAKYVGKLCEGYHDDSGESLYDVYYLWLKKEQEVDYVAANGERRTKKVKGMILEGDNLNPLVGEDIICYGKAVESYSGIVDISFIPAAVIPVREDLKNCTYKDTPNNLKDTDAQFLDNIRESYINMIGMDILHEGQIWLEQSVETEHSYFGNKQRNFDIYGGYMLEDLDNNNVPELIVQGMIDNKTVFFILDHELRTSIVPGEILYNVPGKNLFYTADGYDAYIFYACWYRQSHDGNYVGPDGNFAYMKAFENCAYQDSNGEYVGYDYTDVVLGQNTMRKESRDVSNRLNEVFAISVSPQIYEYSDLSAFDRW